MIKSKEWTKEWAADAPREGGKYLPKGDQPKSKPISLRFPAEVYEWLEEESDRRGMKVRDLIILCVEETMQCE